MAHSQFEPAVATAIFAVLATAICVLAAIAIDAAFDLFDGTDA